MKIISRNKIIYLIIKGVVCVMAIAFLVPVLLTIVESFYHGRTFSLYGYRQLFLNCFPFYTMFWNSVFYAFVITIGTLMICVPAAFAFKFARFKGRNLLYVVYIIVMMMPLQVMTLPNYIGLRDMGILHTRFAIIIPMLFTPFGVVVTHQYMREIDNSVIDSARLETNSVLKVIIHCIIPQIKVCIAAVMLFVFADTWNMVEQPMLYVDEDKLRTLSTLIANADYYSPEILLPASVLFLTPVFLCYLLFHEELKQGLKI